MALPLPLPYGQYDALLDRQAAMRAQKAQTMQNMQMAAQMQPLKMAALQMTVDAARQKNALKQMLLNHFGLSQTGQAQPVASQNNAVNQTTPTSNVSVPPADIRLPGLQQKIQQMSQPTQQNVPVSQNPISPVSNTVQGNRATDLSQGYISPKDQILMQLLGMKVPSITQSPQEKANLEVQTKAKEAQSSAQAQADQKRLAAAPQNLQTMADLITRIHNALPVIARNPNFFGPGLLGYDIMGPSYRMRHQDDPQKQAEMKNLQTLFAELQMMKAKDFSGSRVLASAIPLAGLAKTSLSDYAPASMSTLTNILQKLTPAFQAEKSWYEKHSSAPLGLRSDDDTLSLPPISQTKYDKNTDTFYEKRGNQWYKR